MTRPRCRWCGVFVALSTRPTPGRNGLGKVIEQLLCPSCEPSWLDLSRRNVERIHTRGVQYWHRL